MPPALSRFFQRFFPPPRQPPPSASASATPPSITPPPSLRQKNRILACAAKADIAIQHESSSRYSGTDTDVIFDSRDGIPSTLVSLPLRYMHSVVEMADLADVEKVIALLTAFVLSLGDDDEFGG